MNTPMKGMKIEDGPLGPRYIIGEDGEIAARLFVGPNAKAIAHQFAASGEVLEAAQALLDAHDAVDVEAARAEKPGASAWSSAPAISQLYARKSLRAALALAKGES